jgi:hypothetical protein
MFAAAPVVASPQKGEARGLALDVHDGIKVSSREAPASCARWLASRVSSASADYRNQAML